MELLFTLTIVLVENITVELIDRNGKIESETVTDSLGRFYFELEQTQTMNYMLAKGI